MFAVIKTGGKQYRVQEGGVLEVEKLKAEAGEAISFDLVLLIDDGNATLLGTPYIENAAVRAEVIEEIKGKKVLVFKKKRRKQFRRTRGHRQQYTRVKIDRILTDEASAPLLRKERPEVQPEKTGVIIEEASGKPEVEKPKKTVIKLDKPAVKASVKRKKGEAGAETKPTKKTTVKKAKG